MKLRLINDPILREPTVSVSIEELNEILSYIPEMTKIMKDEQGQGLAANQVGVSKRFFIMYDAQGEVDLIINPEIVEIGELSPVTEGCLSIPGVSAETKRAQSIKIKFRNKSFDECEQTFTDIRAVAVQHEIDHLDGKLYVDQLEPVRKDLVLRKHKKYMRSKL